MVTGFDLCRASPMDPMQWYSPLWLTLAWRMEKLDSWRENFLDVLFWKNVTLCRGLSCQLWHLS